MATLRSEPRYNEPNTVSKMKMPYKLYMGLAMGGTYLGDKEGKVAKIINNSISVI